MNDTIKKMKKENLRLTRVHAHTQARMHTHTHTHTHTHLATHLYLENILLQKFYK